MKYSTLAWWKNFMFFGIRLYEGEGGGGGGGDTFTQEQVTEQVSAAVSKAVDEAVVGLKTKNTELLDKLTKSTDKLKAFGDMTPEKLQEMINKLEGEDDENLLKDGKIDELVQKKVDKIVAEYEEKLAEITGQNTANDERANAAEKRYANRVVSEELMKQSIAAGVRKEAIENVVQDGLPIFTVGEDEDLEARDKDGNLRKLGDKLMTPEHWIDSLKESRPHYWPDSEGAGAQGRKSEKGGKTSDLDVQIQAAADSGNHTEYRRLRKLQSEGK